MPGKFSKYSGKSKLVERSLNQSVSDEKYLQDNFPTKNIVKEEKSNNLPIPLITKEQSQNNNLLSSVPLPSPPHKTPQILEVGAIPTSLGEIILYKHILDSIPGNDEIRLCFGIGIWEDAFDINSPSWIENKKSWEKFIIDIGNLFFSKPPYIITPSNHWAGDIGHFCVNHGLEPAMPNMKDILPNGISLNVGSYIVITTKVGYLDKNILSPLLPKLLKALQELSANYKIVILGERIIEYREEYQNKKESIYSIYDQIISSLSPDRIVDLTLPALGITISDLSQIRQDCLIMKEAEAVITIGVGGNNSMAISCAKMAIGFRADNFPYGNAIFDKTYPNVMVTKDFDKFIAKLNLIGQSDLSKPITSSLLKKRTISALIPIHLGELIIAKSHLDSVLDRYESISLCFDNDTWERYWDNEQEDWNKHKILWQKYIKDIGKLFFGSLPYIITTSPDGHTTHHTCSSLVAEEHIPPMMPRLGHLLCVGEKLDIDEEYIVITTKARSISQDLFQKRKSELITELVRLSQQYKIVILGERIVEMRKEYRFPEHHNRVFSIYDIAENIAQDRICDLTIPTLGNTPYNLAKIQADCVILRDAKFVINLGIGGNYLMSLATANMTIGYREDDFAWNNILFEEQIQPNARITRDWKQFIQLLQSYPI